MTVTNTFTASTANSIAAANAAATASGTANPTDAEQASQDYDDFLLLLTAQIRNQDPLEPIDSTTFVSQLAEFSNVEQQVKMNDKLDNLVASLTANDFSMANDYLGQVISANDGKTYIYPEDTEANFYYQTAPEAESAKAIIKDRFDGTVRNISLPLAPSGLDFKWNLLDNDDEAVNSGLYDITIETTDSEGNVSTSPAQTKVKVLEAHKTGTSFEFLTDTNQKISFDDIEKIHAL